MKHMTCQHALGRTGPYQGMPGAFYMCCETPKIGPVEYRVRRRLRAPPATLPW